ncbi:MAG TPA: hypothetical protein VHB50_18885 [Bryobacteraceae bacterium]|nr:hypothetical protein [Bryobacteraceae bacterium]
MNLRRSIRSLLVSGGVCAAAWAQSSTFTVVSAGNWGPIAAPDSIAAGFGNNIIHQTYSALSVPLPTSLGSLGVTFADSAGAKQLAPLFMVSAGQVNLLVPASAALGRGTVSIVSQSGSTLQGAALVSNVAPAIFAANGNGQGAPAGEVLRISATGATSLDYTFLGGSSNYTTKPISLSPSTDQVFLELYGTGIRRHSANPVQATINGAKVPVLYAGPVSGFAGLDQINIGPLPQSLAGTGNGDVSLILTVDGVPANTVKVNIQ